LFFSCDGKEGLLEPVLWINIKLIGA
jgi:hypothetical protein